MNPLLQTTRRDFLRRASGGFGALALAIEVAVLFPVTLAVELVDPHARVHPQTGTGHVPSDLRKRQDLKRTILNKPKE